MRIEVMGLSCSVGGKNILKDIDAVFEGNQIYGIIGPNGCGKTTLLRHIYRQYPSRGAITMDGMPIDDIAPRAYARRVAVMMQAYPDANMRVRDIVLTGRYPYKKVMMPYDKEDEGIVEGVLKDLKLRDLSQRQIHTLSGGEQQRVMIAKCLVQQPEVIILDEPTNHLDIRYRLELMEMLKTFQGMVIMTLHELNLVARYCDSVYIMKDGCIAGKGHPRDILVPEILNPVFETSIKTCRFGDEIFVNV